MDDRSGPTLFFPFMSGFYERFAKPLAHVGLRVTVGGLLMMEGWPKILDPYGMADFVEVIGLYPGWFWSVILAAMQFGGGLLLVVGFFTRPIALANSVMLLITLWFHWSHPYGAAILTSDGVAAARIVGQPIFTADGFRMLAADGGALFLHQVQFKAEGLSALWTVAALYLAAFGAGPLSVDRTVMSREF